MKYVKITFWRRRRGRFLTPGLRRIHLLNVNNFFFGGYLRLMLAQYCPVTPRLPIKSVFEGIEPLALSGESLGCSDPFFLADEPPKWPTPNFKARF